MKDKPIFWPQLDIANVEGGLWEEVMKTTAPLQEHFSPELDNSAEFTIRRIVHVIVANERSAVEWFFEGSVQSDRILAIYDLLHSPEANNKVNGLKSLITLIKDYTQDVLNKDV